MKVLIATLSLFSVVLASSATEYLGFDLGSATMDEVVQQIKDSKAKYERLYYKGHPSCPLLVVSAYEKFDKFGKVGSSSLVFTRKAVLQSIHIFYDDKQYKTFKVLKDILDSKYGATDNLLSEYDTVAGGQRYVYNTENVCITLRCESVFKRGDERTTTLKYEWMPLQKQVDDARAFVDEAFKKLNNEKNKDLGL